MKQERKIVTVGIHLVVWICFFLLPYIFAPQQREQSPVLTKHFFTYFIAVNLFLLGFYYLNTQVLIPKLLFLKKWFLYIPSVAICLVAFLYLPKQATHFINGTSEKVIRDAFREEFRQRKQMPPPESKDSINEFNSPKIEKNNKKNSPPKNSIQYFPGSFVVFLLVCAIGLAFSFMQQWRDAERKKDLIEAEKANTELSFLKSQVNPHFFFNTLNNIYSLAVVNSEKTAPAVMKLSHIMRYILTETQTEQVPLEKEIDFIKNFIDLQLVRLTDKVNVKFSIDGNIANKQIAPLLFIPFIENAFKYGVSTKENSEIEILLSVVNNQILFHVSNTIVHAENLYNGTTGIGINNVKRRLELSYPKQHSLKVGQFDNQFKVDLEINLV